MADWSLTSLQNRLINNGARVVHHARAIRSNSPKSRSVVICKIASSRPSNGCVRHRSRIRTSAVDPGGKRFDSFDQNKLHSPVWRQQSIGRTNFTSRATSTAGTGNKTVACNALAHLISPKGPQLGECRIIQTGIRRRSDYPIRRGRVA